MKRSEIKPGESFYVITIDKFGSNMIGPAGQRFPKAYNDSQVWKRPLDLVFGVALGEIVTIVQKPGKGDFVRRICQVYGKPFKELVEVIHGNEICVVRTELLYPLDSPMANAIIQGTLGKWPEDTSEDDWPDLENHNWEWKS